MSFTGSTHAVLCALIFFPLNVPSPCGCRPVTVVQFGHMQYVSFYAWCCRRAEQTRHCITKIILMLVIWQMQQRVIYSSDLLASLLSAYLPAKPMDVMIQVLSCILLFFPCPLHLLFIRLAHRSHSGMVRCFARSCAPVRGHVLKSSSSKDAAILGIFWVSISGGFTTVD